MTKSSHGDYLTPMNLSGGSSGTLNPSKGFTLIELLVVMAVILIVVALLLPALVAAKHRARETVCRGNLRQVGCALTLYVDEQGRFPGRLRYPDNVQGMWDGIEYAQMHDKAFWQLAPYFAVPDSRLRLVGLYFRQPFAWNCPSVPAINFPNLLTDAPDLRYPPSFGYNAAGTAPPHSALDLGLSPRSLRLGLSSGEREFFGSEMKWSGLASPAAMISFGDDRDVPSESILPRTYDQVCPMQPGYNGGTGLMGDRHRGGANALFCDSHVEYRKTVVWLAATDAARRQWNADNQPHPETWR